ncbi:26054_t:CDS:10 [Gigaspora margarita]|uniref:26054_t:CDS:1 n=1 Tax=Gigaspora margarita TaxID=4874 RepID=A0ABN7UJE0_GIGMA|nr:26054_t:CDS:10 [Gigaspora margarita]
MPNLGYEIKDFQYHTWNVTNWNNLPERLLGPEFEVGGWKWQILLYPFGNHNLSKISIYLKFADQQGETCWLACLRAVRVTFMEFKRTEEIYAYYRFDAENLNWGSGNFYDQNKLFIPFNNRTRPLIENGSCNITALVRDLKDLTASKESDKPTRNIVSALQKIFYQLNVSEYSVDPKELTRFFGWNILSIRDVRKFIRVLQDDLVEKMKNTKADGTISKLFGGTIITRFKCVDVDYEFLRSEDYYDIQFNVKRCNTLDDSFTEYVQETFLDGDDKYNAEGFGLQSNDRYEFPMEIDLQKYLSPDADRSKPYKYILHGVLIHVDNNRWNQYFALLKPENNGQWAKFGDSPKITFVPIKEMLNDNYENILYNNAYMLIYYRESEIDELLCPLLPKHLPSHLHEENFAYEKEKRGYLQISVMTEEMFKNHKGLSIINLYDQRFPLSEVLQVEILETDTFGTFKNVVATKFKIPIYQTRFWRIRKQGNNDFRLHDLITDDLIDASMEEFRPTPYDDLILYMEVYEKLIDVKKKHLKTLSIIIFLKYFNPHTQSLEGLGQLYVRKDYTINVLFPALRKRKQLPSDTLLDIYIEIEPNIIVMMDPNFTFEGHDIRNGDIICFQKTLMNREIQEHVSANRFYSIPRFCESLSKNVVVHFKSKFGYKDPIPEFKLILNKKLTYKSVVNQVAIHLNIDPLKLRFTSVGSSGEPKSKIDSTTVQTLSKMLKQFSSLYYEIL